MIEDAAVNSLLEARSRIDSHIHDLRDKMAVLSKKRDAINAAIDVLRSSDDMVLKSEPSHVSGGTIKRVVQFDEQQIETCVLDLLKLGPMRLYELIGNLRQTGHQFSVLGLKRILATSPKVLRIGERDKTRYYLNDK